MQTLESAQIPYAVVAGHAVAAWVAQVDEAAVRITRDADILIRPEDLPRVQAAMSEAGFHFRQTTGLNMFVESPDGSAKDAVHLVMAGKLVRPDDLEPNPEIEPTEIANEFRTLTIERLVRMKLSSFRRKGQVHILDMIDVGIIDRAWVEKYPESIASRLQELLDDPDG